MTATANIPEFQFDEQSNLPMWVQLRNRMTHLISTGFYHADECLPTVRKLAAELRISYNTVSKAYMGLEREGYVRTVRGSGVYVNDLNTNQLSSPRTISLIEEFVESCRTEGIDDEDIPRLIKQYLNKDRY